MLSILQKSFDYLDKKIILTSSDNLNNLLRNDRVTLHMKALKYPLKVKIENEFKDITHHCTLEMLYIKNGEGHLFTSQVPPIDLYICDCNKNELENLSSFKIKNGLELCTSLDGENSIELKQSSVYSCIPRIEAYLHNLENIKSRYHCYAQHKINQRFKSLDNEEKKIKIDKEIATILKESENIAEEINEIKEYFSTLENIQRKYFGGK